MKKILFVCSQNRLRSPTAENIYSHYSGFEVKSAGLNNDAVQPLSAELIDWADYIFIMEKSHRNKLRKKFKKFFNTQKIICLDIPDEYEYMDEELIHILKLKLDIFFKTHK